jgi:hypothetical protein
MKLHQTVVQQLLRIYELHGGRRDNKRLTQEIQNLDLMPYTQKENPDQDQFLVMTKDVQEAINASKRR